MSRSTVDFHFDPMCPFAYQTSVWIRDVRAQIGLTVNWRFFSLEEINRFEGKKHPWERQWSYGWSLMRIGALLRRQSMDLLDEWYASVGEALHMRGEKPHDPSVARKLLAELDADPALLDEAISDLTTHEDVKDDHQRVVDAGGFGVPTLIFPDGQRLFGPVLVGPPTGADALKLWNVVTGMADLEHVYELQRPKTRQDLELISEHLQPYLNGRDWVSVNRGEIVDFTGGTA